MLKIIEETKNPYETQNNNFINRELDIYDSQKSTVNFEISKLISKLYSPNVSLSVINKLFEKYEVIKNEY